MRNYPRNSPQAAARIVALTLLADGHIDKAEIDTLDHVDTAQTLGLSRLELEVVLQTFCEDLLSAAHLTWADTCRIDPVTLAQLMAEIDDPALQQRLLDLCLAIADADAHLADGEAIVLEAACQHWDLHAGHHHQRLAMPALA
ncbi:MAG: hypothetical protein RL375_3456 [Pseudomonadota bacterium]